MPFSNIVFMQLEIKIGLMWFKRLMVMPSIDDCMHIGLPNRNTKQYSSYNWIFMSNTITWVYRRAHVSKYKDILIFIHII